MKVAKIVTLILWIAGIAAFFCPNDDMIVLGLRGIVIFLAVAHLIECVVFWKLLQKSPGSMAGHLLNTFLFGVVYVNPLKKRAE